MKLDGRTLDHATLEQIRLMAMKRVREGEEPASVIASYGFCRTTIYKWMKRAAGRGHGLKALSSTRGTGRPRSLTPAQERQVFRWINGRDPRQYGLDFGLWTRAIVAGLIEQKFGIDLGVTAVGALLAKLELTPQKPLQRAYQRDPQAIALWQQRTSPALARQAKRDGAQICLGMNQDLEPTRCMAKPGGCVVRRRSCSVPDNASRYRPLRRSVHARILVCTYAGGLNGELFIELLPS
jgi:transposase